MRGKILLHISLVLFLSYQHLSSSLVFSYFNGNEEQLDKYSIIVDSHIDTLTKIIDQDTWVPTTNIGEITNFETDIEKLKQGNIYVPFFAAYTSGFYDHYERSISHTLAMIHALYWTEQKNQNDLFIASTTDEILSTIREGKIAAVPTIEGAYSLEGNHAIQLLRQFNDLGVKAIGLTWNFSNKLGEGAHKVYSDPARTPSSGGLSVLGEEVVLEMNNLGMMVDVSHMAESTFWDVLDISKSPVIATHSGVHALHPHPRNLTDDQLLALAENGGVVGVVFYPTFLTNNSTATISDVVDHIDYTVDLIGIDHVAIGSDFDGAALPVDLKDASEMYKLIDELIHREYTTIEIQKILGWNTLRVMREIEEIGANKVKQEKHCIEPAYQMGEVISDRLPLLTAKLNSIVSDEDELMIVLNGISYPAAFDEQTAIMSFQVEKSLKEKFHVITFIVNDQRETRIFYIE